MRQVAADAGVRRWDEVRVSFHVAGVIIDDEIKLLSVNHSLKELINERTAFIEGCGSWQLVPSLE